MTNPSSQTSTLAGAIQIVRMHGLARQVPLVLAMLLAGLLEGVGVASLFPLLAIVTQGASKPTLLNQGIEQALAFLHLPLNVGVLCLVIVTAGWLKALVTLGVARSLGRIGATIGQEIRQRLLQALVNAKWSYFTIQPVGRFVSAATTEANWASTAFRSALQAIEQSSRTVIYCTLALFMGWEMALVAISMGVLMGLSLRSLTRAAHQAGKRRQRAMRSLVVELNDVLAGFKPLKAMHRHTGLISELIKDVKRLRKAINGLVMTESLSVVSARFSMAFWPSPRVPDYRRLVRSCRGMRLRTSAAKVAGAGFPMA